MSVRGRKTPLKGGKTMDRQKLENTVNQFFDEYEENRKQLFKKFLIFLGSSAACLILGWVLLEYVNSAEFFEYTAYVLVIAGIVLAVISKKTLGKYRVARKDAEGQLETKIISEIVAEELGGSCETSSHYTKLKKSKATLGDVRKSITKTFSGCYNGKNYKITQDYEERVTEIKTLDIGELISINRKLVIDSKYSDTLYSFDARHNVNGTVLIEAFNNYSKYVTDILCGGKKDSLQKIRMDNKSFPYSVRANDELTAYKYLTPGMMEDVGTFFQKYNGKIMAIESDSANSILGQQVAEINMPISFLGKSEKIRAKYNPDYLYSLAEPSIEAIKALISESARISGTGKMACAE